MSPTPPHPPALPQNEFKDPYAAKLAAVHAERAQQDAEQAAEDAKANEAKAAAAAEDAKAAESAAGADFSLAALQGSAPAGVDPAKKETYLSDVDFQANFAMGKAEFAAMPLWKRQAAKKKAGLF